MDKKIAVMMILKSVYNLLFISILCYYFSLFYTYGDDEAFENVNMFNKSIERFSSTALFLLLIRVNPRRSEPHDEPLVGEILDQVENSDELEKSQQPQSKFVGQAWKYLTKVCDWILAKNNTKLFHESLLLEMNFGLQKVTAKNNLLNVIILHVK